MCCPAGRIVRPGDDPFGWLVDESNAPTSAERDADAGRAEADAARAEADAARDRAELQAELDRLGADRRTGTELCRRR